MVGVEFTSHMQHHSFSAICHACHVVSDCAWLKQLRARVECNSKHLIIVMFASWLLHCTLIWAIQTHLGTFNGTNNDIVFVSGDASAHPSVM